MKLQKMIFLIAGIFGIVILLPQYFLEAKHNVDFPPPITHPEYYYGFIGVALAFQIIFIIISCNPVKYKLFMIPSIIEKFSYGIAIVILFYSDRVTELQLFTGIFDLIIGVLFIIALIKTHKSSEDEFLAYKYHSL